MQMNSVKIILPLMGIIFAVPLNVDNLNIGVALVRHTTWLKNKPFCEIFFLQRYLSNSPMYDVRYMFD